MRQVTTEAWKGPASELDAEVVAFRAAFGETSPLDELVRTGAQRMLQSAIETEVDDFLAEHAQRRNANHESEAYRHGEDGTSRRTVRRCDASYAASSAASLVAICRGPLPAR